MQNRNKISSQIKLDKSLGYIQMIFEDKGQQIISKLTKRLFAKKDLFISENSDFDSGDLTDDLHLTLFYGIKNESIDLAKITKYLSTTQIDNIRLGKIKFFTGYQNQYKVAHIEVVDSNKKLTKLASSFKTFPYDKSVQFDIYRPHVTLAYVKNNFDTDKFNQNRLSKITLPKKLIVKKIEYISG